MSDKLRQSVKKIGQNVYIDLRNNMYLLNKKTNMLLRVEKKDEAILQLFKTRLIISITVFLLIANYMNNYLLALIVSLFLLIITELLYKYWFVKNLIPFQKYYGEDNQPFFKTLCSKPKLGLKKNVLISLGVIGVFGYCKRRSFRATSSGI